MTGAEHEEEWNEALLGDAAQNYPNMRVFDWSRRRAGQLVHRRPGIHYTTPGYRARARMIAQALGKAFPTGELRAASSTEMGRAAEEDRPSSATRRSPQWPGGASTWTGWPATAASRRGGGSGRARSPRSSLPHSRIPVSRSTRPRQPSLPGLREREPDAQPPDTQGLILPLSERLGIPIRSGHKEGHEAKLARQILGDKRHESADLLGAHISEAIAAQIPLHPDSRPVPVVWPGDRFDLIWLFTLGGRPPSTAYLFTELPQLLLAGDAVC